MVLQPIHDIAEICFRLGVKDAIVSPGSRCAPLILSFARHPKIKTFTIPDERSAAFIGLGLSQKHGRPVVLVCTSGTAVLNYGPAVAEAFFQQVPLIILTADRPPEWIDQMDGQTIRQQNIFKEHVKKSFQLPDHYDHPEVEWHIHRIISEAINESMEFPAGPVHVNVPIREPFYPEENEKLEYSRNIRVHNTIKNSSDLESSAWDTLEDNWSHFKKILIVGGQSTAGYSEAELQGLQRLSNHVPIVGDIISNLHGINKIISHTEIFLANNNENTARELKPDLLVTFGRSVISKNLKLFLRHNLPAEHWHMQPAGPVANTFKSLTKIIRTDIRLFLEKARSWTIDPALNDYHNKWSLREKASRDILAEFISQAEFGEFQAVSQVIEELPPAGSIHLANSMPVRLVNYVGLNSSNKKIRVAANRGTSGIDGSNGTAVGAALASNEPVILFTGDLAFFYDRNAFWHNHDISNLKIVLLNNHAGGIFGMIEGPSRLPELKEYFETSQKLTAGNTAGDFGFEYFTCNSSGELKKVLPAFFKKMNKPSLLEIETSNEVNKETFKKFKLHIKNHVSNKTGTGK